MQASVIVTSLNYGEYIARSLDSVLSQTLNGNLYEVIVVDGGSTDSTLEILDKYQKSIIFFDQTNFLGRKGLAAGCNIGIENAKGKYIVRLDADDTFEPELLETCVNILEENPNISFTYSDYFCVDKSLSKKLKKLPKFCKKEIMERGDFLPLGMLCRHEVLKEVGSYNEELKTLENFDLVIRLINSGFIGSRIPIPLFNYYIHDNSMSCDSDLMNATGKYLGEKYGFTYRQNENHPRF